MSRLQTIRSTFAGALALPVLALALSGCTGASASPAAPSDGGSTGQPAESAPSSASAADQIVAIGLKFMPADLTVPVGATVHWVNQEAITHTVTSGTWGEVNESTGLRGTQTADGTYDHTLSPQGQDGDSFEFTFDTPGTYMYFCKPHLGMFGTITVQ
jgi:plastocyanin